MVEDRSGVEELSQSKGDSSTGSVPMAGLPLAGAMMGLCLGGPVGVLAGVKLGGVAALGGSILGYTGASVIKEQKDMRKHIDDHYKKEPQLYVLTPKEEALLSRRRNSNTSETIRQQHPCVRRAQSESPRHLPSVRNKKAAFRSSRTMSESRAYSNSANNSPRRREEFASSRRVALSQSQIHQRFEEMSAEDQRTVIALLRQRHEQEQSRDSRHLPQSQSPRRHIRRRLPTTDGTCHATAISVVENKRRQFARQHSPRASSLPDVLEEDTISNKS